MSDRAFNIFAVTVGIILPVMIVLAVLVTL